MSELIPDPYDRARANRGEMGPEEDFKSGSDPGDCPQCAPFACDDPDRHLGVPSKYTPLANQGCHCGADFDGRDCMCFEGPF